jgi:hypothetical protein
MVREDYVNAGAAGAIISPWWLPPLHDVSTIAAEIAPILGIIWLVLQMVTKLIDTYRKWKFTNALQVGIKESQQSGRGFILI